LKKYTISNKFIERKRCNLASKEPS